MFVTNCFLLHCVVKVDLALTFLLLRSSGDNGKLANKVTINSLLNIVIIQIVMIVTKKCDNHHFDCETLKLEELEASRKDLEASLVESQGDNR